MSVSNLSYRKFCEYIERKSYSITGVYLTAEEPRTAKFFECRTPVAQKTFFVYIPSRYRMVVTDHGGGAIDVRLVEEIETPFEALLQKARRTKEALGVDTIILSKVIHIASIEEAFFIRIDKAKPRETKYDPIDDIEARATDIGLGNIGWKQKTLRSGDLEQLPIEGQEMKYVKPSKKKEKVQLVFVDEKNVEVVNLDDLVEKNTPRGEIEELEVVQSEDNSVPSFLNERETYGGSLFIAIDVNSFFHMNDQFEKELISKYDALEEMEHKDLQQSVKKVQDLVNKLSQYLTAVSKEYIISVESVKKQLLRLTAVLTDTSVTKKRFQGRKKPLLNQEKEVKELDSIIESTRRTIHEIQMSRLHQKEVVERKISDALSLLSDLIAD